MIVVIK